MALAYAETRIDDHDGAPSAIGGYGVMHLVSNPSDHTLERAERLTGSSLDDLCPARGELADTQGSYAGTISWFQNPAAQVSAHYVRRALQ